MRFQLHISAKAGVLYLWVETSGAFFADEVEPQELEGKGLEAYPYAADHDFIRARLGEALGGAEPVWLEAWLPPLLEDESVETALDFTEVPDLEKFAVPAFRLDLGKHLPLISQWTEKKEISQDLKVGSDVVFWGELLTLASAIVANFRFRRVALLKNGAIWPGWGPDVFDRQVGRLLKPALDRVPLLAHSLSIVEGEEPLFLDPDHVVTAVLFHYVHQILEGVRALLSSEEGARRYRGRGRSHAAWLSLLREVPEYTPDAESVPMAPKKIANWETRISSQGYTIVRPGIILNEPRSWSPKGYTLAHQYVDHWRLVFYVFSTEGGVAKRLPFPHAIKDRGRIGETLRLGPTGPEDILEALFRPTGAYGNPGYTPGHPGEFFLSSEEAGRFLKYVVPELQKLGFELRLPAWFRGPEDIRLLTFRGELLQPGEHSAPTLSLDQLLKFRWEVAVGGEPLTQEELEKLVGQRAGLVRLGRRWVFLRDEDFKPLRLVTQGKGTTRVRLRDVLRSVLAPGHGLQGVQVQEIRFPEQLGAFVERLKEKRNFELLSQPKGFVGALRRYQITGFSWLVFMSQWGLGSCLADDMGLGKTIQTLALVQYYWERGERRPVLLVCPTSVVYNWKREAERFTPELPVLVHHGADRDRSRSFLERAQEQALVISSYSLLAKDLDILSQVDWQGVVLDEAQNIKNPETKQARAARSLRADYRIALTGTPVENNVGELWSIMEFLNPGWLGSRRSFRTTFLTPIEKRGDEQAATQLRKLVGPFILRREKTDRSIVSDLPEKLEMKVYCNLTREQGLLYKGVLRKMEEQLEETTGMKRRGLILATLTRLKQICNHPAQYLGDDGKLDSRSGKLTRLVEMLEEILTVDDRALIFTQFAKMGALLQRYLSDRFGVEVPFLHGGVPGKQRERLIAAFQAKDGPPIFVLSLKAGGLGLNLTRANHVFHFDRWWNPAVENQATDRAFRIGQHRNVQVHKFICVGTLEENIDRMIERKKDLADRVVGAGETWLTELSNEEIRKLLALRPEALEY